MNGFKKVVRDSFRKITLHAQEQAAVAQTMKANVLAEKQMYKCGLTLISFMSIGNL